jgi:hypothetical protein
MIYTALLAAFMQFAEAAMAKFGENKRWNER